ncbi:DUF3883 domain-containing protein [Bradyrhizobium sp. S69]|uniref:DUF3883 domain-containing protein n=1 Tax=Bradyrhizobium sp. S69 TaxID=1641856 RepID=UPI00131DD2C5|nr:DUF3883 domain-containing protein [Bradyrhizobium sp. S69]
MQYAIKKLTMSDLTLFEPQFRRLQAEARLSRDQGSKQKGINLNADVFAERFFPAARADGERRRFNIPVTIYGPGASPDPQTLTRKVITAGSGGKNWRLNGELIPNPDFDPNRYDQLRPGDLVLFAVGGTTEPTSMVLVLLSQTNPHDAAVYSGLSSSVGNRKTSVISEEDLRALAARSPAEHPVRELIDPDLDEALEEAAAGSSEGLRRLRRRGSPRRMTAEAFREARLKAEATGLGGEQLLKDWLEGELSAGRIQSYKWVAEENAINPWDFEIEDSAGEMRRVEVKTTRAGFERPIQISQAELEFAAEPSAPPTDLYRLFDYTDGSAKLSISRDIREAAKQILAVVQPLSPQVRPDAYTVAVSLFSTWSVAEQINIEEDEGE